MKCIMLLLMDLHLKSLNQPEVFVKDILFPHTFTYYAPKVSHLLKQATQAGHITGFKASHKGPYISHLLFVDDSLIFYKAHVHECHALLSVLKDYERVSG